MRGTLEEPESHTWVDTERREVAVVAGPFHVPQTVVNDAGSTEHTGHGEHDSSMKTPLLPVVWPVDGGLRGFRLGVFSGDGTPLPRSLIHHLHAVNFDRRELVYPVPARLLAIGAEPTSAQESENEGLDSAFAHGHRWLPPPWWPTAGR